MKEDLEIELKLRVMDAACWSELCTFIETLEGALNVERVKMAANYFDTEDGALKQRKIAYRVRAENGKWVATLKGGGSSGGGLHRRAEWNVPVPNGKPDLSIFTHTDADLDLLRSVAGQDLQTVVRTEFQRRSVMVIMGESRVEVSMDEGQVIAGGREAPILEVELELKEGCAAQVLHIGALLAKRFPLIVERQSKFLRGLLLRDPVAHKIVKKAKAQDALQPIYDLLDIVYDAWVEGKDVDHAAYGAKVVAFANAFSPSAMDPSLMAWPETLRHGNFNDVKSAIYVLLSVWAKQIANKLD